MHLSTSGHNNYRATAQVGSIWTALCLTIVVLLSFEALGCQVGIGYQYQLLLLSWYMYENRCYDGVWKIYGVRFRRYMNIIGNLLKSSLP
jgi:hypothetical protein